MATVKVKFRPLAGDAEQGRLYIQIIHERQVKLISTPYIVNAAEWDSERGGFVASGSAGRREELYRVNHSLQCHIGRVKAIISRLDKTMLFYNVGDIADECRSYVARFRLFAFFEHRIGQLKLKNKIRTAQNYRSTMNSFKSFLHGEDIIIDLIDADMIERYEAFLQARRLRPNTTSFYMRVLRAVCNTAADEGAFVLPGIFRHVYTGVDKTEKRALPLTVLRRIHSMDLAASPALDYARDIFMLSFFTRGMSFIDMAFILKTDLNNGYLTYSRHKTRQMLKLKWTAEMQRIIDKYPSNTSPYLFPILINPQSNLAYAYRNISYRINSSLKKIAVLAGYPESFTLYSARHSWAYVACTQGVPISVISQGMGHDSERTTRIYISSIDSSAIDRANSKVISSLF
ncbi:site-specific integrase [Duncaniella muris]|uniref:site-specific integrase n=1 Tax=Duncaniella muris TaxID=2094150 RepID=UPI002715003C|nr:site-specific integrase [Duncaniella muris]